MRRFALITAAFMMVPAVAMTESARLAVDDLRASYALGNSMMLMVGVRNHGDQLLSLRISDDSADHLVIRAVDQQNRAVPFRDDFYVRQISRAQSQPANTRIETVALAPSRAYLFPVDLSSIFQFPGTGVYHVHVALTLSPRFENAALTTNRHVLPIRIDDPIGGRDVDPTPPSTRITPPVFAMPQEAVLSLMNGRLNLDPVAFLAPIDFVGLMQQYPEYASRYERVGASQRTEILELFKHHLKRTLLVNLQQGFAVTRTTIIEDQATVSVNARTEPLNNVEETLVFHLEHQLVDGREGWRITHLRREQRLTP